jgi:purine-nucleoside phosphorylase
MTTYHNTAKPGAIAKTVLMPGDPLRAKFVAENYFDNPLLFNEVRGMFGYTGAYKGKRVSVMGSGMGIPSIGIYSYELFNVYDVDRIIRIGSAGSYAETLKLYDVLLITDSFSDSTYAKCQNGFDGNIIPASVLLCDLLRRSAKLLNIPISEGRVHSSDAIYYNRPIEEVPYWIQVRDKYGCLAVDMESFSLFHNAKVSGKESACLLTISDQKITNEHASQEEREKSFTKMMEIALGILL